VRVREKEKEGKIWKIGRKIKIGGESEKEKSLIDFETVG